MGKALHRFWRDEEGQDLVEFSLLICFMALGAVGLLRTEGTAVQPIWGTANTTIHAALNAS